MNNSLVFIPDNYDDLSDWLSIQDSNFSAAELHGAIIGGLCGRIRLEPVEWVNFIFAFMGVPDSTIENVDQNTIEATSGLATNQLKSLLSEDISFRPFLPDDDEPIDVRIESVSFWCRGFLGGFAEAQSYERNGLRNLDSQNEKNLLKGNLSENVTEALTDLGSISKVALLDDEGNEYSDPTEISEQAEKDLVEVIEFIRLAILTVFAEYGHIENLGKPTRSQSNISDLEFPHDNKTVH